MSIMARRIVALAATGLFTLTGVAVAAPSGQYGGPTSQKVGGSALRIAFTVGGGALANVRVEAIVEQGGAACSLNGGGGNSFDFSKGTVRIDRQGSFNGKLTDPNGNSVKISGRFTGETVDGAFEIGARAVGQGTSTC